MLDMSVQLGPLRLANPVVAASGFFGFGDEYAPFFDVATLGAFTTACVGLATRDGAPAPRLVETPSGVLRAGDLGRLGVESFMREKLPFLAAARERGLRVIVHIDADPATEVAPLLAQLDAHDGIDAYEVSVGHGEDGTLLLAAARAASARPLVARLPAAIPGMVALAIAACRAGADVLSLIDAVPGLVIDPASRSRALGSTEGVLSGPAIRPVALRCVHEVAESVGVPIIGMGGIANASDATEFLLAGADAVGIASAVMANPRAPVEVLAGMREYCVAHGWHAVANLTGSLRT